MFRILFIATLILCGRIAGTVRAQEPPSGVDAATAMEKSLIDVIARCEKSVVAIARVRKEQPGETFQMEFRPDPFGRRPTPLAPPQPTDQPGSGEEAMHITEMLIKSNAVDMIVIDSVAALVPKKELEGEIGDSHVGLQARLMAAMQRFPIGFAVIR